MRQAIDSGASIAPAASLSQLVQVCFKGQFKPVCFKCHTQVCIKGDVQLYFTDDTVTALSQYPAPVVGTDAVDGAVANTVTGDPLTRALNDCLREALGKIGYAEKSRQESDVSNVKKFLGRLLGLPVLTQNTLFCYFFSVMEHTIACAIKEGRYTNAVTDLFGPDVLVEKERVEALYKDPVTGAHPTLMTLTRVETHYSIVEVLSVTGSLTGAECQVLHLKVDRGLSFEAALHKLKHFEKALGEEKVLSP